MNFPNGASLGRNFKSPTQHVLVRAQILAGCILYKAQLYIARVLLVVREVSTNSTRNKYPSKHGV
ncbi:hypothetical protein PPTG_24308 [Phytophthora nicotianae INRA-310]|uniref:Uncharacterized protein n=1 Tax=Phytophthora nicotianae (strain INRA-310) TaxID=761204 RepID=W2PGD1_PHYN3|nr:hypothetical protein PPTG_24308 [Phytophthora nicotianae INRA-310]ETN00093.1 hypothetical protein PPTG_24308 [Phytophthora nicotianae INRA-310]